MAYGVYRRWPYRRHKRPFPFSKGATTTYQYTPTGGITFGGTATLARTQVFIPSGGLVFAGTSAHSITYIPPLPTGGLIFAGSGVVSRTFAWLPTGGLIFSGSAGIARTLAITPTGGITFAGEATVTTILVTPTVSTVEGVSRNEIFKRFLRETGLGVYGTVTGVAGGATVSFDDSTRLKSTQYSSNDWIGGWARIGKNANSASNAPENETFPVTNYDPTTNGRITAGTYSASIEVSDEYQLWRFPNPQTVIDDLDVVLKEDIFLPCWSVLSEHPDFDMEQNNTTDWEAITGSIAKVITGPYIGGKRYLGVTASGGVGSCRSANEIKVEPSKKYYLSASGYADDDNNTLTLAAYDVTNGATITSKTVAWSRQYPGRLAFEFTTPATCFSIKVQMSHASNAATGIAYWDEIILYPMETYDIALPWWVKNKNQIRAVFGMDLEQIGTDVYDSCMRGQLIANEWDIRDDAFGKGQLRLVKPAGNISRPLFIFGVRNEVAFANDTVDTKRVDANLIIAALARKVFKRLKVFPNSNAMQLDWVQNQYEEWERNFSRLQRQQSERLEEIMKTIPASGMYSDPRFTQRYN